MTEPTYLSGWKPELCIQLDTESNHKADFNRFLVKGFPCTESMQQRNECFDAQRKEIVLQLKERFDEIIEEGGSHTSLHTIFWATSQYLNWCDNEDVKAFTKLSLEGYMGHEQDRVMLGKIKQSTYKQRRSQLSTLFTQYLDLPSGYFSNVVIMDDRDTRPFEAYTRSDLNQLLPFLRKLFNQTYQQFIDNPSKHIKASKRTATMTFTWKGKSYSVCAGISKMMCSATFLLAYYTYTNTGDLMKLCQPNNASTSMGEAWYSMPAFKRRAFKTIQVEMGEHDLLEVPKYAMKFFDKLLNASRLISCSENTQLLKTVVNNQVQSMKGVTLQGFLKHWVEKHFAFTDQTGKRLRPIVSRFRETGSQLTAYHQGEMVNSILLNNTPSTRKKNYSEGSRHTNNGMLQDTVSIRQEQIESNVDTKQAKENLGLDVLVIEAEYKVSIPELSRTPTGSSCVDPFGEIATQYMKKARSQHLAKEGEKLACADLLKCFGCPNQVIIQSVSDIWCLLSFKACIEESLYIHLDAHHYRKNFESTVTFIETNILPHLKKNIIKQAESKLNDEGYHPLWHDIESVLGLAHTSQAWSK
ncbi:hypothetical protein [Vibrio crassostreae]|uniref:hypothetical protein n=1 Tax=Vibrio crassostreae TaxID=246167 RepID=UPI001B313331|nr:hypothetical protein [Vibrio crassostreae]CAK3866623.1 conserved hypothetical protein [Vibrio crassostreae]